MIIKIGLIAAALGPVITIIGTLVAAIGALMSPIGLVVLAIGAAIAAGVALYKNWDEICAWAKELKDKVIEAWNNLKEKVVEIVENVKEFIAEKWDAIKQTVSDVAETIKTTVSDKFEEVKNKISDIWENAKTLTSDAWEALKQTVEDNGGGITGILQTVSDGIGVLWEDGLNFLDEITGGKLGDVYDWFTDKLGAIKDFANGIVEWLKGIFNFEWTFPHINLPHFSWEWLDLGGIVSLPVISVDWYKKAYDTPYLFTDPTVVGGRGFGDGGGSGEIVYGRDQLMRDIAEASSGDITINVYANEGMNVNQLADRVSERLAFVQRQRAAAYA